MVNTFMNYQVIDNFLDPVTFLKVKNEIYGPNIPWFHNEFLVYEDELKEPSTWCWQLTHTFYKDNIPRSESFYTLDPILVKLNPAAILKIKANLMPRTDSIIEHRFHIDISNLSNPKAKTAVYYINNNNGYTLFENGSKVESKENRMLIFDSSLMHTGTSCTDARNRCVINFNYFQW